MKSQSLKNKRILLCITGGIAAYRSLDILRALETEGASVDVAMTEAATRFIPPLTVKALSTGMVYTDIYSPEVDHITLTREADLMLVAPATANTIGKFVAGIGDNPVTLCFLAFNGPVVFAPAMNWRMYEHPVVRKNIQTLRDMGCYEVEPDTGRLACGEEGKGRMASVERIMETVRTVLSKKDLSGRKVVVTAGPTLEPIDPVRYISNRSSGKMGYAIARDARRRGAEVVLISGPTQLLPPEGVHTILVETTEQMLNAVLETVHDADIFIMAAAVADFRLETPFQEKLEKEAIQSLKLTETPDIVETVTSLPSRPFVVGFSAETGPNIAKAKEKMIKKGMDMIVFNDVTEPGAGFGVDTNHIVIIDRISEKEIPLMSKEACAGYILDAVVERLSGKT